MDIVEEKHLRDLRWVPVMGTWEEEEGDVLIFKGSEYDPPPTTESHSATPAGLHSSAPPDMYIEFGQLVFNQRFTEGRIKMQVEFADVDHRSNIHIMIQGDLATGDMLTFGIGGGGVKPGAGTGPLYGLRLWSAPLNQPAIQQGTTSSTPTKVWTPFIQGGEGKNLKANRAYDLEVTMEGSLITIYLDSVEIGKYNLPVPSLPGRQFGIFCGSHSAIRIRHLSVGAVHPKAFIVMQFDTPEYEALFTEVIAPICREQKLRPYRADSTYLPGVLIADIKKQIAESRVVIAEITPANLNVYYEIGYADALNKPLILIADKAEGLKPFDVRAYRTIFYQNSIGGKTKVEKDLRQYLQSIMAQ